jgi:hypothetical protein
MKIRREMMLKQIAALSVAVHMAFSAFSQERGTPMFQDSFDTNATFAENWVLGKGWTGRINSIEGKVLFPQGGRLSMRRDTPEEFYAEMDVTVNSRLPNAKSLFCGFDIEGFLFTITPDGGFWMARSPKGSNATCVGKKIEDFQFGKPVKLALIRKVENGISQYICRIDGKEMTIVRFTPPVMKDGKYDPLCIFSFGLDMTVDNFGLFTLKRDSESPNLVINSGFEYDQDGFPPYLIRCFTGDITKIRDYEKDYLAKWSLDTSEKHGGKQSVKITKDEFSKSVSALFGGVGIVEGGAGVFSIWMKADRDNFPVTISYAKGKQVLVSREWKRYEVVNPRLPKPGVYSPVSLSFKEDGTLWIDDLQAEFITAPSEEGLKTGKTFATPYKPSELDKARFVKEQKGVAVRTPEITVPKLPSGVVPGEDLDAWKSHAVKLDRFYCFEKIPKTKTEAYLACDKDNFYVAYRCFVNDLSKVNTEQLKHDTMIFSRDAVEMLVDPLASEGKFKYYQFFAYPGGSRADKGLGLDSRWDGNWKSQVKLNEKNASIDYILSMPFSDFANPEMKEQWVMNLHRYDAATGEATTLIKCMKPSFVSREYWPLVNFPADVIKSYAVGVASGGYSDSSVNLDFVNNTGRERKVTVEVADTERRFQKLETTLRPGLNSVSLPWAVKDPKVTVRLTENSAPLSYQIVTLEKSSPVSMLGRLNYYMNEAEAPFRITAAVPEAEKMTAVLTCGKVSVSCPAAPKFKLALPLKEIADGTHNVVLKLEKDGKTVTQTSVELVKRPYKKGATQVNHFSRSLIHDGKNVFFFGPLVELNSRVTKEYVDAKIAFFVENGFKTILFLSGNKTPRQVGKFVFDAAMRNGILVNFWSKYNEMTDEDLDSFIQEFDYPNIVANLILDEPEISSMPSAAAKEFMLKMRKKLPYQPCNINYTVLGIPARYADLETDILGLDDYLSNSEGRTVESVLRNADIMWKAGEAEGKPCWFFLVDGNSIHHPRGEISFGEQVAQCYGVVTAGGTGLEFYNGMISTLPNWRAFVRTNRELQSLADVLCSEEECEEAACDAVNTPEAKLRHRTKKLNGEMYVISVNTGTGQMDKVAFTLPAGLNYTGEAEVLFENRKLPMKDGKFTDEFGGHERHVYKIKLLEGKGK